MSDAVAAIGAEITIDGIAIEEVGDISGPTFSTESIDVTSHDSPGGGEEKIPGLKRYDTISFPMNVTPTATGQQALVDSWEESPQVTHAFVVTFSSGVISAFDGFVSNLGFNAAVRDRDMLDIEITIASQPTNTWPSA